MRSKVTSKRERVSLSILPISLFQRLQCIGEILPLRIEEGLALGLLGEFIDGGEVDGTQARQICLYGSEAISRSITVISATSSASTSSSSKRVCTNCSTSDSRRRRVSCAAIRAARALRACHHAALGQLALFIQPAQFSIHRFQIATGSGQLAFDLQLACQQLVQLLGKAHHWLIAITGFFFQLLLPDFKLCALLLHAHQRRTQ